MQRVWPAMVVCLAAAVRAQEPEQRALLDLYVNEVKQDTVLVYLPEGGDALVPVEALTRAGLHGFAGQRQMHDGAEYVSVLSLAPQVRLALDLEKLEVHVTAVARMLGTTEIDLRPTLRPAELVLHTDTSAFLNYSLTGTTGAGVGGAAELGGTWKTNLVYTGLSMAPGGTVTRGLSNLVMDTPSAMRRTTLGDGFVAGGALGGSVLLGGISIAREFSLDPYFVRTPMPRLQGAVLTPSTLDVYVNGTLVRSMPVQPGTFEVQNLPVNTGAGTYSYVLRDAFGRTTEYAAPYYASPGLLSTGVSEYAYGLGLRRENFGVESFSYGPPVLSAMHRLGLTDRVTAGYRFEAAVQHIDGWDGPRCSGCAPSILASGGASIVAGLPFGQIDLEGALSADGSRGGAAATLGYAVSNSRFSAGVSGRAMSRRYANLSLGAEMDRAALGVHGFAGVQIFRLLSASVDYDLASMRDTGLSSQLGLRLDARLGKAATLSTSIARVRNPGEQPTWMGGVALLYTFGERTYAHGGAVAMRQGVGTDAGVEQSLPLGEGIGYQLRSTIDPNGAANGMGFVQAQMAHGIVSTTYNRFNSEDSASGTVAGALVAVGGELYASRPVQQGYALVQVPGVEGVRGYLNNQEIGRTDGRGDLLIPGLQPYYGNRISISAEDLPLDYVLEKTNADVAPAFRGGSFVKFDAHRIQAVSGMVKVFDEVPAYGELTVSANDFAQTSPVGASGQFFLERMHPGRYHAAVEFKSGTCSFELDVPALQDAQIDVGQIVCTQLRPAATAAQ